MNQISYANITPKISPNVEISYRDNEYIITLIDSNFHLKISSKLFNLLDFVDNTKNIPQIVNEFNKRFYSQIDENLAYELLYKKLGHYNIIENSESDFKPNNKPSYLRLNIIVINAARTKILSKPFLFLFSNIVMSFFIPICFLITSISVIRNYDEIFRNLKNISSENIALYIGIMIISSLLHELGHATATYKFGGDHSGIGMGFYLFTPVMYADVSSAWKFDVGKRIIVNLAGIYFELLLSTLLILISFCTRIESLMLISLAILFKTLYNLNPFFRSDGYWVLSDSIRVPNLRATSNDLLKKLIKFKMNFKFTNKELFLIFYALISNAFIVFFLFYLFIINPSSLITFPVDIYLYVNQIFNNNKIFSMVSFSPLLTPIIFYFLVIRLVLNYIKKQKTNVIK